MSKKIIAADLFCGAGGTSTGIRQACEARGYGLDLLAINHWDLAISTHTRNHQDARHICETLDSVDPRKEVPGGRLHILTASPECTHHSVARGGKPINDQSRATAWHVLRWAEALHIDNILVENVPEFLTWGPLGANGKPLKSRAGETFQAWLNALRSLNYTVDYRVLCAADYGDPTTRKRLFVQARRGRKKITWPDQTHAPADKAEAFGLKPWRAAREIIDWSNPGESIFRRKKPLAASTLARIEAGLRKFGGPAAEPFIVALRNNVTPKSADEPLGTVTAGGNIYGLCEPFLVPCNHGGGDTRTNSLDAPMPTVTTFDAWAIAQPFLLGQQSGGAPRSADDPVMTVSTDGAIALVQPFVVGAGGPTGSARPRSVDAPMGTVLTDDRRAVVEPFLIPLQRAKDSMHSVDRPMRTVTATSSDMGLVEPFLMSFYGSQNTRGLDAPSPTIPATDVWGMVETDKGTFGIDIRFRMLQPGELAGAQGFPKGYQFSGTREDQVKQIGNAVPCHTSTALVGALLDGMAA